MHGADDISDIYFLDFKLNLLALGHSKLSREDNILRQKWLDSDNKDKITKYNSDLNKSYIEDDWVDGVANIGGQLLKAAAAMLQVQLEDLFVTPYTKTINKANATGKKDS